MSILKVDGGTRLLYLQVYRILIKMADAYFSSSWRIREPHGGTAIYTVLRGTVDREGPMISRWATSCIA